MALQNRKILAQAAFAKLSEMPNLHEIENHGAYLFRAAVNNGLNAIAHLARVRRFVEREFAVATEQDKNALWDVLSKEKALQNVEAAMALLSKEQREIVMRSRLRGETYEEISAATGWSKAFISRRLTEALSTLFAAAEGSDGG